MVSAKMALHAINDKDSISIENKMLYLARIVNDMDSAFVTRIMDDDGASIRRDDLIKKIIVLETQCEGLDMPEKKKAQRSKSSK